MSGAGEVDELSVVGSTNGCLDPNKRNIQGEKTGGGNYKYVIVQYISAVHIHQDEQRRYAYYGSYPGCPCYIPKVDLATCTKTVAAAQKSHRDSLAILSSTKEELGEKT